MAPRLYDIPVVDIQEVVAGNTFAGVAPTGTETKITDNLGRERYWLAGTAGGEYNAAPVVGSCVSQLSFTGPGTTRVQVYLVDRDDVEYLAFDTNISGDNPADFTWVPVRTVAFFPNWKLRVRSTGALTGDGRCALVQGRAWVQELFV